MRALCTILLAASTFVFLGCASKPQIPAPVISATANADLALFSDYLNLLTSSIQQQWYRILGELRRGPPRGTQVVVRFKLNSSGDKEIVDVEDKGCGKLGVQAVIAAMDASGPHPKWTDEMIAKFGTEQTLTFEFIYQ